MPRFVVLEHQWEGTHWDFMLESGENLRVWALNKMPDYGVTLLAKQLADHRPLYLEYEGEISDNRGHVTRWDTGTFEWLHITDETADVRLQGSILKGHVHLHRQPSGEWSFRLEKEKGGG